jgi:basic membrane protein A
LRRLSKITMAVAAASLVLAGCGDNGDGGDGGDGGEGSSAGGSLCESSDGDGPKIGVAYDVGGRGDQSFNDSAFAGVEQAVEELDATCREVEAGSGENDADREERLRLLADAGYNPIIAVGFIYSPAAATVAEEYPDVNFAVVDGYATFITGDMVEIPNVADLNFAEQEGSFLVGVAAALKTETDNVGFVGGVNGPLIQKFEAGFKAGVEEVNPDIQIQTEYLSQDDPQQGFENPAGGETAATGMYENGADIVYHAAGKSGLGVFDAAQAAGEGNWAIGVDSDQYLTADPSQQPFILTSMLKRIDVAVLEYVTAFADGEAPSGVALYDLSVDGVGYSTSGGFIDDITDQIDEYAEQIKNGEIEVPETP